MKKTGVDALFIEKLPEAERKVKAFDWLTRERKDGKVEIQGSFERGWWVAYHHPQGGFSCIGQGPTPLDAIEAAMEEKS